MWRSAVFFVCVTCLLTCESLRILGVISTLAYSHYFPLNTIVKGLADKGHEVTLISFYERAKPHQNLEDIVIPKQEVVINDDFKQVIYDINTFPPEEKSVWITYPEVINNFGRMSCEVMQLRVFQEFLESNRTFDLLIIETFSTDCYLGLVDKFKVPFISYSSMSFFTMHYDRFAQPDNPAYIPVLCSKNGATMSFLGRVQNTLMNVKSKYDFHYGMLPRDYIIAKEVFGNELRPLEEIAMEVSLFLINSHFSYFGARPNVPGVIEVGGVHIVPPDALPKKINENVENSLRDLPNPTIHDIYD